MTISNSLPRAVVLISGSGSNLQAIIDAASRGDIQLDIALVISNDDGAYGLQRARVAGIDTAVIRNGDYASREEFDTAMAAAIEPLEIDVLILAGFMRILTPAFVDRFRGRLLNIHPSLLPEYPGLHTHQRVLEAHEKWHGCTVHFVTAELDAGPPLVQARIAVREDDTVDELAARVLELEHRIYPLAADLVASRRARFDGTIATLDGKPLDVPLQWDTDFPA